MQAKTSNKPRKNADGTIQSKPEKKQIKDLSKFLVPGRQICYCQCTRHGLVNNCVSCGKVVCEQEGEGPCLFCGAWVDRETMYDVGDENMNDYEVALQHRDRLIEYDVNAAQRLGVLDAQSDWFDLANNTWLNKEQRKYAAQMQEVEKKRQEDIDSKMNVTFDLQKGTTSLKTNEEDPLFTFGQQNKMVNEYLSKQANEKKQKGVAAKGSKYRPFEDGEEGEEEDVRVTEDLVAKFGNLKSFQFKAYTTVEEKQAKIANQKRENEEAKILPT